MTQDATDEYDKLNLKPNVKFYEFFGHRSNSTIRNSVCVTNSGCSFGSHEEEVTNGNDVQHLEDHSHNRRYWHYRKEFLGCELGAKHRCCCKQVIEKHVVLLQLKCLLQLSVISWIWFSQVRSSRHLQADNDNQCHSKLDSYRTQNCSESCYHRISKYH